MLPRWLLITACLASSVPATGQLTSDCIDLDDLPGRVASFQIGAGDHIDDLCAHGDNLAFLADRLYWCLIADDNQPEIIGSYTADETVPLHHSHLLINGTRVLWFAPDGTSENQVMRIIDFDDPLEPSLLSSTPLEVTDSLMDRVATNDNLVVMSCPQAGLLIFDITDPEEPVLLSRILEDEKPHCVALDGSRLWVTGGLQDYPAGFAEPATSYIRVYDISNPSAPALLSETFADGPAGFTATYFKEIQVENGRGMVNRGKVIWDYECGHFGVLHYETYVNLLTTESFPDLTLEPLTWNTASGSWRMLDGMLVLSARPVLTIYPRAAEGDLKEIHRLDYEAITSRLVVADGRIWTMGHVMPTTRTRMYCFAGDWQGPTATMNIAPDGHFGLVLQGDKAFAIGGSRHGLTSFCEVDTGRVMVYDISDPNSANLQRTVLAGVGIPGQLFVHGNHLFSRGQIVHWPTGTVLGASNLPWNNACDVDASTTYLYTVGEPGLAVVDMADAGSPDLAAMLLEDHDIIGMCTASPLAYVIAQPAAGEQLLVILDVTAPLMPSVIDSHQLDYECVDIATGDNRLYLACTDGFRVLDATDPSLLRLVSHNPQYTGEHLCVSGEMVYLQGRWRGIRVIDCADPMWPDQIGLIGSKDNLSSLRLHRNRLYFLDDEGLTTARLACREATEPDDPLPEPPARFALVEPYPNPFNPRVQIDFSLESPNRTELSIYDLAGRRICTLVSGYLDRGEHDCTWDGRDDAGLPAAAGVYFVRLAAGPQVETRKLVMLK